MLVSQALPVHSLSLANRAIPFVCTDKRCKTSFWTCVQAFGLASKFLDLRPSFWTLPPRRRLYESRSGFHISVHPVRESQIRDSFRFLLKEAYRDTRRREKTENIRILVGSSGLEPPTSRLSGVRSNHLSYEPMMFFGGVLPPDGGDEQNRTVDPLLAKQVLSQLSYTPTFNWVCISVQPI